MIEERTIDTEQITATAASGMGRAMKEGAAAGARAAHDLWGMVGNGVGRGVYGAAYYVAYGATFGAMLVGHLIPRDSLVAKGMRDGAGAAVNAFEAWEHPKLAAPTDMSEAIRDESIVASH